MSRARYALGAAIVVATLAGLGGCATPAEKAAMTVDKQTTVAKRHPYSVAVDVRGGAEAGAARGADIGNADLKAAVEASIQQTQVFREVVQGTSGQYLLAVSVINLSRPIVGFSMTVEMEAGWTLTRVSDGQVVYRKSLTSTYTAGAGDAFAGAVRVRLAVEGATRANVAQGLKAIGELSL